MLITLTITAESPLWDKPKLFGGVAIQSGMSVLELKRLMEASSHLIEQRLVDEGLLGVLETPRT